MLVELRLHALGRALSPAGLVLALGCGGQTERSDSQGPEALPEIDAADDSQPEQQLPPAPAPVTAEQPMTQRPDASVPDAVVPDEDPCACPSIETSVMVNVTQPDSDAGTSEAIGFSSPHPESEWAGTCGTERIHSRLELGCGARLNIEVCASGDGALPCLELRGNSVTYTDASGATYTGTLTRSGFTYDDDRPDDEDYVIDFGFVVDVSNAEGTLHLEGEGLICGATVLVPLVC